MSLAAGKLRHRIQIEEYVDLVDSNGDPLRGPQGEFIKEWQDVFPNAEIYASIEPIRVREFIQSAAVQSELTTYMTIRYRDGLSAAMRVVHLKYGAPFKIYNPAGWRPDPDSGMEYLVALCSEGVNDGQ
jgi:SPP1 family predicted phage head-tail adaptor